MIARLIPEERVKRIEAQIKKVEGDINDAWWGLCADRQPVTLATLAERLGYDEVLMARLAAYFKLPLPAPEAQP